MKAPLAPASLDELTEAVRATPRLLAVGAGTKPRLSAVDAVKLTTVRLSGITEYEPGEFTFTALAGTPVRDIAAALAGSGQHLPFDPMLADAGATLGGTVASGLNGPGRFHFGGARDFILGVRFVEGEGRLLRLGGKVVKNAAGFDLPKFFVGSLGRFGVLGEITFKVFPRPVSTLTVRLAAGTMEAAARLLAEAANSRHEFDAIDLAPGEAGVLARLAGPEPSLAAMGRDVLARWGGETIPGSDADSLWAALREFRWADPGAPLVKVALSPTSVVALARLVRSLSGAQMHVSAGGNVAFVSPGDPARVVALGAGLRELGLTGMTLRGEGPLWPGAGPRPAITRAVKRALDPQDRFPSLDD